MKAKINGIPQKVAGQILLVSSLLLPSALVKADTLTSEPQHDSAINAAQAVLDEFMLTFNQRNMAGWANTLNYPHVRFASGEVKVWRDVEEFSATSPFGTLKKLGWDHSHWISRKVVMSSAAKVHIATVFERYNKKNESIGVYESLYIVTRVGGRWGIQSRSSLAP